MDNKINSIKDLVEKFIWLENKYDLLNFEYCGVKIWQLYRLQTYYDIAKELNILDEYQFLKDSFTDRFKNIFSFIRSVTFYNPFLSFKKREILIFDSGKKVNVDIESMSILKGEYFE